MGSNFRDLRAYRLSRALSRDLRVAVARWPKFDSIGANIAEGCGRWHPPDQRRFFFMARGSLFEAEHWMLLAADQELLPSETLDRLAELAKPLSGLIKSRGSP